ncbi:hypothetical protein ElyMa_002930800 [Elysia marginata]|uniref:Uncharacterized protein n=1 Tax=Elysia marginata TaxID=1093978 RepID=A0AAV4I465_9GAST|nr:hypothetical protein ElyMa_002930800 [Elysia marginata]
MESAIPCSRSGIPSSWFSPSNFSKSAFVPANLLYGQRRNGTTKKAPISKTEYRILTEVQDLLHLQNRYISELRCAHEFARNGYDSYVREVRMLGPLENTKEDTCTMHEPQMTLPF